MPGDSSNINSTNNAWCEECILVRTAGKQIDAFFSRIPSMCKLYSLRIIRNFLASTSILSSKISSGTISLVIWFLGTEVTIAAPIHESGFIAQLKEYTIQTLETGNLLMLAVFAGAMSFALMSASWVIRDRNKIANENEALKRNLADARVRNHINESLININDQRLIVWNSPDDKPSVMGQLDKTPGAPADPKKFMQYGKWLTPESAASLEIFVDRLRQDATSFDVPLETKDGGMVESQGRTSGSHAFVRFIELSEEREQHAKLSREHSDLLTTFQTIQSLFEKMPVPIWLRRDDDSLFWANQAYADAVEAQDPQTAVSEDLELFDKEQRKEIQAALENSGFFSGERPAVVAGDRRSLEIYAVKSEAGIAGIASDRSDVEHLRATLKETVESHSMMLDQLATAVAIFDRKQELVFYNTGFQNLWKFDPTDLESKPSNGELLDLMRDRKMLQEQPDWRKWQKSQLEIYTALEPNQEWWHLPDGQTLRVIKSPRNQGGATWIFENVTEQLKLESNYNALMRVQGETLDHLVEAVAVFGSDGRLKLFNPMLKQMWKFKDIAIVEGTHIAKIVEAWTDSISNESDLETIIGKITGFDDQRDNLSGRLDLRNEMTLQYTLVPLPDGQTMITFADITANVGLEKALRERAEALEESDHLKSRFIQHVSYELRAPLTSISGFGEILATPAIGILNEKQKEYLAHISESADVLRAIVDDILDLATIDANAMELDFAKINLNGMLDELIASFELIVEQSKIKTEIAIESSSETVIADPDRLYQILRNLISNAINYSPDGGVITITATKYGDLHEISISDEGPGVEEDMKESIFNRFEGGATNGKRSGTGLGLSIVEAFVKLHGGTIHVEATEMRGARFVCRLPASQQGYSSGGNKETVAA